MRQREQRHPRETTSMTPTKEEEKQAPPKRREEKAAPSERREGQSKVVVHVCITQARRAGRTFLQLPALRRSSVGRGVHRSVNTAHLSSCAFPCVCGAHSTGTSRGVHFADACLELSRASPAVCVAPAPVLEHMSPDQQFTVMMCTKLAKHVAIQAETFTPNMSETQFASPSRHEGPRAPSDLGKKSRTTSV